MIIEIIGIGVLVAQYAYQKYKSSKAVKEKKEDLYSTFDFPRAEEGGGVTVFYGRCRLRSPQVVWVGALFQ